MPQVCQLIGHDLNGQCIAKLSRPMCIRKVFLVGHYIANALQAKRLEYVSFEILQVV